MIGHFCGNRVPPPITTTFNLLWIRFVSDGLNQGRGVRGSLKAVTCNYENSMTFTYQKQFCQMSESNYVNRRLSVTKHQHNSHRRYRLISEYGSFIHI